METVVRESGGLLNGIHRIQWELFRGECDVDGRRFIKIFLHGSIRCSVEPGRARVDHSPPARSTYSVTPFLLPAQHTHLMQRLGSVSQPRVREVRAEHLRALIEPKLKEVESYGLEWCVVKLI